MLTVGLDQRLVLFACRALCSTVHAAILAKRDDIADPLCHTLACLWLREPAAAESLDVPATAGRNAVSWSQVSG